MEINPVNHDARGGNVQQGEDEEDLLNCIAEFINRPSPNSRNSDRSYRARCISADDDELSELY